MITENRENNNFTAMQNENKEAKQRLNNEYLKLNGAKNTEDTVGFFTKHNRVFQVLAILFTAIGIYFDLLNLVGLVPATLIGLAIGIFLEFGKDRLSRGVFNTSLEDVSRWALTGGTLFIIMLIALLFHIRSIDNFANMNFQKQTGNIYKDEIALSTANTAINLELAKALNNGTSVDDVISAKAIASNNNSLKNISNSKAKDALLYSFSENKNTLKGILYLLFISVEFFSLFGIFGMLIIQRNTDKNLKSLITTQDKLLNIEANVYKALETKMIDNTLVKIEKIELGNNADTVEKNVATLPSLSLSTGEKGQIWSNANTNYPTLPTNITKIEGTNGSSFFKGTAENFTDAYEGDGFKVEKYPIVPRKPKRTRIVKNLDSFKILDDVCRDTDKGTEFESEKVNYVGFDEDFISAEEWEQLSEESRVLALKYVDMSMFDAVEEVPMIQIVFENGLVNTYDEPLLKKTEAVASYKKMKGCTIQDARDVYVRVMEKLEKQDKIVRRSRYHNRCQGINIGTVTIG